MKVTIHFSVYKHQKSILFDVKDVVKEIRRNNVDLEVNIGEKVTFGQIDFFMNQLLLSLNINIGDKRQTNYTPFGGTAEANDSLELAIRGITYYFNTDATYMFIFRSVKGIDFSTFPKHNRYDIIDVKHRNIYDYAIIGDFRHGIAIAHTTECDFLINSQCEIIFFPRTWYGTQYLSEQQPRFTRNERGFYVETAYIDRSAPGKDTNFQGPYVIGEYSEEQIKEEAQSPIYPYIGKPYEEGRHMFLNGAFYKLDTLEKISHFPTNSCSIDSPIESGWCDFHDEKYHKKLLVEVHKNKIVRFDDITSIYNKLNDSKNIITNTIVNIIDSALCNFTDTCILDEIASFNESGPIIDLNTKPHLLIWLRGFANLKVITDNIHKPARWTFSYPSCYSRHLTGSIGYIERVDKYHQYCIFLWKNNWNIHSYLYNLNTGKLIFDYKGTMSFFRNPKDDSFLRKFNVLVGNKHIVLINNDKIVEYREMPANLFRNANACCSNGNEDFDNFYFYGWGVSQMQYIDTNYTPLKCLYTDEIPNVSAIIENYLYKVDGLSYAVNKNDNICDLKHRDGDKLLVTSERALKELNDSLSLRFAKGNPYVRSISKTDIFKNNSNTSHYIFDYMPYGKYSVNGKIYYKYEPDKIWL